MTKEFTRQELYDLVWAQPMREVAEKYEISNTGLAKVCARAGIPVPERGYWNKLKAGKKVRQQPLTPRGLGKSDTVSIGGDHWYPRESDTNILTQPLPPPPVFDVDISDIRAHVVALVASLKFTKSLTKPHRLITKLLADDEARLQKKKAADYPSFYDDPYFDNPFERRRMKILNSIFIALEVCGMKPGIRGKTARKLYLLVGDQRLSFKLDGALSEKQAEQEASGYRFRPRRPDEDMRCTISVWAEPKNSLSAWQDNGEDKIEGHLHEIVVELMVGGEVHHRQRITSHHNWLIKRKAELEEQERQRRIKEEERRRRRAENLERLKIAHLLGQATALRQANEIRFFVHTMRQANCASQAPLPEQEFREWEIWATEQADRLDPVKSGKFSARPSEEDVDDDDADDYEEEEL